MSDLTIGIIATLAGSIIWQIIGLIFPKIKTPVELLLSLFRYKKQKIFSNFNDAQKYINKGIQNSKSIKYMSIRGFPLIQETYALKKALKDYYSPLKVESFEIMISDPEGYFARLRAKEYSEMGDNITPDRYLEQIKESIKDILELKKNIPKIIFKLHNTPAIYRICIFDNYCLVGFYTKKYKGSNSPVYLFDKKDLFYEVFERYFNTIWNASAEYSKKTV